MLDEHAENLIHRRLGQSATPEELAQLDRLVSQRPEVAEALWEAARVEVLLTLRLREVVAGEPAPVRPGPLGRQRRRLVWGVVAVAATLLVGALLWSRLAGPAGHPVVAGVVEINGSPATRVFDDAPLRVVGDRPAVIELAGGAHAELQASTAAVIRRPDGGQGQVVELLEGGGRFHVPHRPDRPFSVRTCNGSVTALGTDFEVNLWSTQGKGDQEMSFRSMFVLVVAVATGMVEVDVPSGRQVLSAGSRQVFGAEPGVVKHRGPGDSLPRGDVVGFTGKGGRPFALEASLPGVVAALELTKDQRQKIAAAVGETTQSEKVRAAMVVAKLNPNATPAQKEEARNAISEARSQLQQRVEQILTDEQKKLVASINAAAADVTRQVAESMPADFAKGDERAKKRWQEQVRQRVQAALKARVLAMLNPTQKAALEKAAAAQIAAEKAGKGKPKGPRKPKSQDTPKAVDKTKSPK